MKHNLDYVSHVSKRNSKLIHKITAPLLEKLDINYFARQTVNKDGEWEIIANNPEWLEHSADCGFYNVDPSLLHPDHYQSGLAIVSSNIPIPDFLQEMARESIKFNLNHTLCLMMKTQEGCEWYFFAADNKNHHVVNTYISKFNMILQYINYFKFAAKKILHENLDYKIIISDIKQQNFQTNKDVLKLESLPRYDELYFLNELDITLREKDCLQYLIQGKTAKETAKILDISHRTVEHHLAVLKNKFNFNSKRELISLFNSNTH